MKPLRLIAYSLLLVGGTVIVTLLLADQHNADLRKMVGEHTRQINSLECGLGLLTPAKEAVITVPEATKATPTAPTAEHSEQTTQDTLTGAKGGRYIMVVSKKTGKPYKKYIKS